MAYYREKYGEDFVAKQPRKQDGAQSGKQRKPGKAAEARTGKEPSQTVPTSEKGDADAAPAGKGVRGVLGRLFGGRNRS